MSAFLLFSYTITDPSAYEAYPRAAMGTMAGSGAEVLAADYESEAIEGAPGKVTVLLRFESKDAARAWYDSEGYASVRHLRTDSTEGTVALCDGFEMPA